MPRRTTFCLFAAVLLCAAPRIAEAEETPGVTEIAPGVTKIEGDQVPAIPVDVVALEATIAETGSFKAVRRMLGSKGIANPGPGGSTTHMYKIRDTASEEDKVLILFVKGGEIVHHMIA